MGLTMYCNVPYHGNVSYRTVAYRIVLQRTAPVLNCIVSCRVVLFRIVLYKYFSSTEQKKKNLITVIYNVAFRTKFQQRSASCDLFMPAMITKLFKEIRTGKKNLFAYPASLCDSSSCIVLFSNQI